MPRKGRNVIDWRHNLDILRLIVQYVTKYDKINKFTTENLKEICRNCISSSNVTQNVPKLRGIIANCRRMVKNTHLTEPQMVQKALLSKTVISKARPFCSVQKITKHIKLCEPVPSRIGACRCGKVCLDDCFNKLVLLFPLFFTFSKDSSTENLIDVLLLEFLSRLS